MYEPRDGGRTRPGVWYAVTDSGQWIDMAGARLICVPALSVTDQRDFDLAAGRSGGAELARFAELHGVTFYDVLSVD